MIQKNNMIKIVVRRIIAPLVIYDVFFELELFFMSKSVAGSTYQYFPTYLITAVIYLVLTFTITRILLLLERRFNDRDFILESSTGAINVNTQGK